MSRVVRNYDVVALDVPIIYNADGRFDPRWILYDASGMIYALKANEDELNRIPRFPKDKNTEIPPELREPHPLVRPLVLRACKGEMVRVHFENHLNNRYASIHLQAENYDPALNDGSLVGRNASSAVQPGGSRDYEWCVDYEGVFFFSDMANLGGEDHGSQTSNSHGLFGALVVEPEGSIWTDPETGNRVDQGGYLGDGLYADVHPLGESAFNTDIHPDTKASFREYVIFFQDQPHMHVHPSVKGHLSMAISYRSEPMAIREERMKAQLGIDPGQLDNLPVSDMLHVVNEEQHHSSWLFGDPATPVLRAYIHDPAKIRLVHSGVKETHVFHLHVHQWLAIPQEPDTQLIDSITIGPQATTTIEPLYGAGSRQGTAGDVIWHCHLYPHFHQGMWGIWRVHDVLEDGSRMYPDGTQITALKPLPGLPVPPEANSINPGFPLFIPGETGKKSPPPPFHPARRVRNLPDATEEEEKRMIQERFPGEAFVNIGPRRKADRVFDIVVLSADIVYNNSGWHDIHGHLYCLAEDEKSILSGEKNPEPLFIRANKGEVIELHLTNKLDKSFPETDFDLKQETTECGLHVHLVKFDPIVADGSSVGWNYLSGVGPGETMTFRWWVDEEFGTIFFHDHLLANFRQKSGLFAAMIAEPEGAEHLSALTCEPILSGTSAIIHSPDGSFHDFREFCIAVGDFIPLFYRDGRPINPPKKPGSHDDQGGMGVNYRCEPLIERKGDPSLWFSSLNHGDPATPVFHTYPGDPIRIRLLQGSHEEQHSFLIHGMRWPVWWLDNKSKRHNQQTLGISEAFTMKIDDSYGQGDYLWLFGASDDLWLGCWGIIRSHKELSNSLCALPDNKTPDFSQERLSPGLTVRPRKYKVHARKRPLIYNGSELGLTDPYGLIFEVDDQETGETLNKDEPLVLRCRVGEWVEVEVFNDIDPSVELKPEPNSPAVPVDDNRRRVSKRVSLHAHGLIYDIQRDDGTAVGTNPDQTIAPGNKKTYRWLAQQQGVVLLQDMADFRNHRHHGLVGALVIEPEDITPLNPITGKECWVGTRAEIQHNNGKITKEMVLILQDGLRLFIFGSERFPFPDPEGHIIGDDMGDGDPEDQGSKGFNYRTEPLKISRGHKALQIQNPATPVWEVTEGDNLRLRLVVVGDKPRNHTFTVHGHLWPLEPYRTNSPTIGAISALSTGSTHDLFFKAGHCGDYAYRTGILKYMLEQGLWGIIRVKKDNTRKNHKGGKII